MTDATLETLHSGHILKQINHVFITLFLKVPNPEFFNQYRSISLRNVIYEGISRCLTNPLKHFMSSLIGPYQNAFIPGWLIGDSC